MTLGLHGDATLNIIDDTPSLVSWLESPYFIQLSPLQPNLPMSRFGLVWNGTPEFFWDEKIVDKEGSPFV